MTFKTKFATVWVLGVVAAALIGWDIFIWAIPGGTISETLLGWATKHPIVPFAFGVLMGHLFWYQQEVKDKTDEDKNKYNNE